jgi:hypothetical protein
MMDSRGEPEHHATKGCPAFVLPVADQWLVYAPLSGVSALVNRPAVARLRGDSPAGNGQLAEVASLF